MTRKRIALSVRPEYQEKLAKLAKYQDTTITTVVGKLLNECESAVDVILKAHAEIQKGVDKNKVLTNMLPIRSGESRAGRVVVGACDRCRVTRERDTRG